MGIDSVGSNDDIYSNDFLTESPKNFECGGDWNGRSVSDAQENKWFGAILDFFFGPVKENIPETARTTEEKTYTIISRGYSPDFSSGSISYRSDASRFTPPKNFEYAGSRTNTSASQSKTPTYDFTYPNLNPNNRSYIPPANYGNTGNIPPYAPLLSTSTSNSFNIPNPFIPTLNGTQPPINIASHHSVSSTAPQSRNYNPPPMVGSVINPGTLNLPQQFPDYSTQSSSLTTANTPAFGPTLQADPNFNIPMNQPSMDSLIPSDSSRLASQYAQNPSAYTTPTASVHSQEPFPMDTPSSGSSTLSFIKGFKAGAVDSVTDFPSAVVGLAKTAASVDSLINPIVPNEKWISQVQSVNDSVSYLRTLDKGELAHMVAPDVYKLVTEWDTLPKDERANLSGYCVGKYGTDFALPIAAAKGAKIVTNLTKIELAAGPVLQEAFAGAKLERAAGSFVQEGLPIAERQALQTKAMGQASKILPFTGNFSNETNVIKIREILKSGQNVSLIAKELGFSGHEIAQLGKTGTLHSTVAYTFETIVSDKAMIQSLERFKNAENFLKPYRGQHLAEIQAKELIHQAGIKTFPKPNGIPDSYRIKLSDKPGGLKYVHPENEGTYIRIMPGKPHSPFPHQRQPYVNQRVNGKSLDKFGNEVPNKSPEAHIPINEFIYKEWL